MVSLTMNVELPPDAAVDLHMHTTYSDGQWPAERLLDYLVSEAFDLVSVTDHDRVDKVAEIQEAGKEKGLPVLSGVEMSTEWNGKMGDLLCFGFDPLHNELSTITAKIQQRRTENARNIYDNLQREGYEFPRQQEVLSRNNGEIFYPHEVGMLLREHGYAANGSEAFRMIQKFGYTSTRVDMGETVEAVHRSGGVCLIAHPGRREQGFTFYSPELLDQVRQDVPIDGIEIYHPSHSKELNETYLVYATQHDLLMSAGSDSHSNPRRMPIKYRAEISRKLLERVGVKFST